MAVLLLLSLLFPPFHPLTPPPPAPIGVRHVPGKGQEASEVLVAGSR
jgi:hypothetical protein